MSTTGFTLTIENGAAVKCRLEGTHDWEVTVEQLNDGSTRKIYVENPKHQGDPYWAFVDNKLLKLREQLPSALMLAAAFNKALVDDRALYENGNKALYKIVSPLAIPKFQSDVEKAILAVQQTVTIGTGGLTAPGGSRGGSAGGGSGAPS